MNTNKARGWPSPYTGYDFWGAVLELYEEYYRYSRKTQNLEKMQARAASGLARVDPDRRAVIACIDCGDVVERKSGNQIRCGLCSTIKRRQRSMESWYREKTRKDAHVSRSPIPDNVRGAPPELARLRKQDRPETGD